MIEQIQDWPPIAGHYQVRLVKEGPLVGVRIYFGAPLINGEPQDRSHRWCVEINGETTRQEKDDAGYRCSVYFEVEKFWPFAAKNKITEAEYRYLVEHSKWARAHAPHLPDAQPRKKIDRRGASVF